MKAQKIVKRVGVEVRKPARFRDRPDIRQLHDAVRLEQFEKMVRRMGRVPDRENCWKVTHLCPPDG